MNTAIEKLGRALCVAGVAWTLTSCSPDKPQPVVKPPIIRETPPKVDKTQEVLTRINQEVRRLTQTSPQGSITRRVYSDSLAKISPSFMDPLMIGIVDPKLAYARTILNRTKYSPEYRFSYYLNHDRSLANYATLEELRVAIYFSPVWLDSKIDAVKMLALEKEAYTLALWEPFSQMVLDTYLTQGRINRIDPSVTDAEIARTMARQIVEDSNIAKLYDYAGYLPVLRGVSAALATRDPQVETELGYSNLLKIYNLAKDRGVKFEDLRFGSEDFLRLAFDSNGSWSKMILDPAIPGPASNQ